MTDGVHLGWTPWDNCSYPAILDYPDPQFPEGPLTVFLAALILAVCCFFLGRICDLYFLPAVKIVANRWGLKGDLMSSVVFASAAGWPELTISVITVFDTEQAGVGIGTIVGTSVFNTLAVPALCSFCIAKGTPVNPMTTSRDTAMTAIALLLLGLVLKNDRITWMEALLMLSLYVLYTLSISSFANILQRNEANDAYERCQLLRDANKFYVHPNSIGMEKGQNGANATPSNSGAGTSKMGMAALSVYDSNLGRFISNSDGSTTDDERVNIPKRRCSSCATTCSNIVTGACRIFLWPIKTFLRLVIPPAESFPYLVILFGIVYISLISYVMAWMITILGYKLSIPNSLLSLTVLAVGLGYPDLISSLKVAKEGTASEALSNTLGANTFNILVCLGLPWFIKAVSSADENGLLLNLDGVLYSVNIMFSALLMFYATLLANKFVFNAVVGCVCIAIYLFFVITMALLEFNVFFFVNKPLCNIKDYYADPN